METERFFIWDASSGQPFAVRFESLSESDREELGGPAWAGARFREVWLNAVKHCGLGSSETVLKLVAEGGEPDGILGLLLIGAPRRSVYLKGNLLETVPRLRFRGGKPRIVNGIGVVLIARLILESQRRGKRGRVLVKPATGSEGFYLRLGFARRKAPSEQMACDEVAAPKILSRARYVEKGGGDGN